jgi:hypothetical protein
MATWVEIGNAALTHLGDKQIISLEDNTPSAGFIKNNIHRAVDYVLRLHNWNFSIKRVSLAPDTQTPAFGWKYQFTLPSDFIRFIKHETDMERIPFVIENKKILCNESVLNIRYVFRVEDPTGIDSLCAEVIALQLAIMLSNAIPSNSVKKSELIKLFEFNLSKAKTTDSQEGSNNPIKAMSFLQARLK